MEKYDVIIVGAGSMGMAAGYYLAKKVCTHCLSMHMIHRIIKGVTMGTRALYAMPMEKGGNTCRLH